jgi:tyrosyl-tRNA synthetase
VGFLEEIGWRGLHHQTAGQGLEAYLATPGRVAYCGFDPTRDSLTIGNFVALKLLMHWQRAGHRPVVVMGGGTGLIGDPSGKDAERRLLSRDEVAANVAGQRRIFERCLDFDPAAPAAALVVDNAEWLGGLGFLDVLRDVGKHFSVNTMIQKDSVRDRLHNREQGISYTEFSYMVLQAYDFLHLYRTMDCRVQLAGSDQWGNIVAGIDLIRRVAGPDAPEAYGVTAPLLTGADGRKIGKTESGAVWLTSDRTSPYRFHQYWINVDDADVGAFLRWFTFLTADEIAAVERQQAASPEERPAQRALARAMTELLHGAAEVERAETAAGVLFGRGELRALDAELLADVFADVPHSTHARAALGGPGAALADLLPETTLATSKRQAREFLANGAVFVNGERAAPERRLGAADLLHGTTILLRRGKKSWHALRWA